jgi:hypothetical protein
MAAAWPSTRRSRDTDPHPAEPDPPPNFAADPLVVGLGCEKLTSQRLMGPERASDV